MMRLALTICAGLAAPVSAQALMLEFPASATLLADQEVAEESYFIATDFYSGDHLDGINAEGDVRHRSWKVGNGGLTTLQLIAPLRDQLKANGFELVFECETRACGGFDFRYLIRILPEPYMHVNLGDYRYLSARKMTDGGPEHASLMVSRSANAGFVQLTSVDSTGSASGKLAAEALPAAVPIGDNLGSLLESSGHAVLYGLEFKAGSAELEGDSFGSLANLANYLNARPDRKAILVGHTDAEGSFYMNIDLSKRRAASVLERLVSRYGVNRVQLASDGVGYLSPRASNLTPEGRKQNRRVEAILAPVR